MYGKLCSDLKILQQFENYAIKKTPLGHSDYIDLKIEIVLHYKIIKNLTRASCHNIHRSKALPIWSNAGLVIQWGFKIRPFKVQTFLTSSFRMVRTNVMAIAMVLTIQKLDLNTGPVH